MNRRVAIIASTVTLLGCVIGFPATGFTAPATPVATSTVPGTAAGTQLDWLLAMLNGETPALTEADVTARFSPTFLALLPPAQVISVTRQFSATGPLPSKASRDRQPTLRPSA